MPGVQPVLVERFLKAVDLRAGHLNLRLALLREVARSDVTRKQANDYDHHQQLEQGKTVLGISRHVRQAFLVSSNSARLCRAPRQKAKQSDL